MKINLQNQLAFTIGMLTTGVVIRLDPFDPTIIYPAILWILMVGIFVIEKLEFRR